LAPADIKGACPTLLY